MILYKWGFTRRKNDEINAAEPQTAEQEVSYKGKIVKPGEIFYKIGFSYIVTREDELSDIGFVKCSCGTWVRTPHEGGYCSRECQQKFEEGEIELYDGKISGILKLTNLNLIEFGPGQYILDEFEVPEVYIKSFLDGKPAPILKCKGYPAVVKWVRLNKLTEKITILARTNHTEQKQNDLNTVNLAVVGENYRTWTKKVEFDPGNTVFKLEGASKTFCITTTPEIKKTITYDNGRKLIETIEEDVTLKRYMPSGITPKGMRIVAKIKGKHPEFLQKLSHTGIEAKQTRNNLVVFLPEGNGKYVIPEEIAGTKYKLYINCSENGGAMSNTGNSVIICDLNGARLKPYFVPRKGHLSCGEHAFFSVPSEVVSIHGSHRSEWIEIYKHQIVTKGNTVELKHERLWMGFLCELPAEYEHFKNAAHAARKKANCYHCRCSHYAG